MAEAMDLKAWDVPFSSARYPSILLISESHGDSTVLVVLAPDGTDRYPKYLVRFSAVYA